MPIAVILSPKRSLEHVRGLRYLQYGGNTVIVLPVLKGRRVVICGEMIGVKILHPTFFGNLDPCQDQESKNSRIASRFYGIFMGYRIISGYVPLSWANKPVYKINVDTWKWGWYWIQMGDKYNCSISVLYNVK